MNTTAVVDILVVIFSGLAFFAGLKRTSNTDIAERARSEGEIKAKLDQLLNSFEKLENKLTRNTSELYEEIDKRISEHEKRYHSGK